MLLSDGYLPQLKIHQRIVWMSLCLACTLDFSHISAKLNIWCGGPPEHGFHAGWISEKEMVGEMSLVTAHNLRRATVVTGEHGVELITFERSTFNHLGNRAQHDVGLCRQLAYIDVQTCLFDP